MTAIKPLARIGDQFFGICHCHGDIEVTGSIITGSNHVFSEGQGVARIGDIVLASCGHTGVIDTGSSRVFISGIGAARLGDHVGGTCLDGNIVSGSPHVRASD